MTAVGRVARRSPSERLVNPICYDGCQVICAAFCAFFLSRAGLRSHNLLFVVSATVFYSPSYLGVNTLRQRGSATGRVSLYTHMAVFT